MTVLCGNPRNRGDLSWEVCVALYLFDADLANSTGHRTATIVAPPLLLLLLTSGPVSSMKLCFTVVGQAQREDEY